MEGTISARVQRFILANVARQNGTMGKQDARISEYKLMQVAENMGLPEFEAMKAKIEDEYPVHIVQL